MQYTFIVQLLDAFQETWVTPLHLQKNANHPSINASVTRNQKSKGRFKKIDSSYQKTTGVLDDKADLTVYDGILSEERMLLLKGFVIFKMLCQMEGRSLIHLVGRHPYDSSTIKAVRGIRLLGGPTQIHLHWIKPQGLSNYDGISMQIQEKLKTSLFQPASFMLPFIGTHHFTPPDYRNILQTDHTFDCKFMLYRINDGLCCCRYSALWAKRKGTGITRTKHFASGTCSYASSIIFMDEISIRLATMVSESGSSDSEVQRTMLELLNLLDGFEASNNIKLTDKKIAASHAWVKAMKAHEKEILMKVEMIQRMIIELGEYEIERVDDPELWLLLEEH
ncbi:hypothetical protein Tco_0873407 [Tanacetum coccineum]